MDEPFELPVTFRGEELLLPAQLLQFGYTHKFRIEVYGTEVLFEPDEERNYRAVADPEKLEQNRKITADLLQAIAAAIETLLR